MTILHFFTIIFNEHVEHVIPALMADVSDLAYHASSVLVDVLKDFTSWVVHPCAAKMCSEKCATDLRYKSADPDVANVSTYLYAALQLTNAYS